MISRLNFDTCECFCDSEYTSDFTLLYSLTATIIYKCPRESYSPSYCNDITQFFRLYM